MKREAPNKTCGLGSADSATRITQLAAPELRAEAGHASRLPSRYPLSAIHHPPSAIHYPLSRPRAFTLIELLVVIAIMGLLAAIAMPMVNKLKPNAMAAATQKLLADVGRARQLAIAHHTKVYMVFVWPNFWNDPAFAQVLKTPSPNDLQVMQQVMDKQFVGYTFVSLRSMGDQPGRSTVRYLDSWRTLPEGVFIPWQMFSKCPTPSSSASLYFATNDASGNSFKAWFSPIAPFSTTNGIPFPTETAPAYQGHWVNLPFIAFNYLGQLVDANDHPIERTFIPLSQGTVLVPRDSAKVPLVPPSAPQPVPPPPLPPSAASALESPVGNTTNTFNIINIDGLTGRARLERQEVM